MDLNENVLITLVQANDLLYNKKNPDFKNAQKKKMIWDNIGKDIGTSGELCKKRFANLREKFTREVRQQNAPSGSGAVFQSNWPFFEQMQFLRGHLVQRQQRSNFNPVLTSTETAQDMVLSVESMCDESFSAEDCIIEETQITDTLSHAVMSPPTQRPPQPKRKRHAELDEFCAEFRASATSFAKVVDSLEAQDKHIQGFVKMASGSLEMMGH